MAKSQNKGIISPFLSDLFPSVQTKPPVLHESAPLITSSSLYLQQKLGHSTTHNQSTYL